MSGAIFVAVLSPVFVSVAALFFIVTATSSEAVERKQRRARALARYRHHPDANLLSLTTDARP
jgi:hypothetical protein